MLPEIGSVLPSLDSLYKNSLMLIQPQLRFHGRSHRPEWRDFRLELGFGISYIPMRLRPALDGGHLT